MSFELLPIIDKMLDFYQNPRNSDRFQVYLKMLQGDTKGDLVLPIGGFNPMAKEHILDLRAIQHAGAPHQRRLRAEEVAEFLREPRARASRGDFDVHDHPPDGGERGGQGPQPETLDAHGQGHGEREHPPPCAQQIAVAVQVVVETGGLPATTRRSCLGFVHRGVTS